MSVDSGSAHSGVAPSPTRTPGEKLETFSQSAGATGALVWLQFMTAVLEAETCGNGARSVSGAVAVMWPTASSSVSAGILGMAGRGLRCSQTAASSCATSSFSSCRNRFSRLAALLARASVRLSLLFAEWYRLRRSFAQLHKTQFQNQVISRRRRADCAWLLTVPAFLPQSLTKPIRT